MTARKWDAGRIAAIVVLSTAGIQAQVVSITDATTPPAIQPGAPAGSYALSGFESVNLYSGHLNFTLPLYRVVGRGEAGFTMYLPIERNWRIENRPRDNVDVFSPRTPELPGSPFWGNGLELRRYSPGLVVSRSVADATGGTFWCSVAGQPASGFTFYQGKTLTRLTYIEPDGTEHELRDAAFNGEPGPAVTRTCASTKNDGRVRGREFRSADGTALTFVADQEIRDAITTLDGARTDAIAGWLIRPDGVRYRFDGSGRTLRIQDRNGNEILFCYSSADTGCGGVYVAGDSVTIRDSLGRVISVRYADVYAVPAVTTDTIVYPGYNGQKRTITVGWSPMDQALASGESLKTSSTLFEGTNASSSTPFNPWVVSSVRLPDASSYQFKYNAYGELARAQLPTGGAFEYTYPSSTKMCPSPLANDALYGCMKDITPPMEQPTIRTVFRRIKSRKVLPDGVTTERVTVFRPEYAGGMRLEEEDQDTNETALRRTVHHFIGGFPIGSAYNEPPFYVDWREGKEVKTERKGLESGAGTQTVTNTWGPRACVSGENCWFSTSYPGVMPDPNICLAETQFEEQGPTMKSAEGRVYDRYSNQTDLYEYGYTDTPPGVSSGCPTSFSDYSRHTKTTYVTSVDNTAYDAVNLTNPQLSIHLRRLPESRIVYGPAETEQYGKTEYLYDESSQTFTSRTDIQHQAAGYDSTNTKRGNPTTVRKWRNASSYIDYKIYYDVAGNATDVFDGNSKKTTLTYGGPLYAFATSVCKTVTGTNRCFSQSHDLSTGSLTLRSDLNGVTTEFVYDEPLDRLTKVTRAANKSDEWKAVTSIAYTNSNRLVTVTSDQSASKRANVVQSTELDGLGRESASTQNTGQGSIVARRRYDTAGRAFQVSNPHAATTAAANVVYTTTEFDSLDRILKVVIEKDPQALGTRDPNGIVTTYNPIRNEVTITDPAGADRKTVTDAFGRLTQVVENPSGMPLTTTYHYDALDRLLAVDQGQSACQIDGISHSRCFSYDWLGRLSEAHNPESGRVCYGALSGSGTPKTCTPDYDGNGNLQKRTDARGVSVVMQYDEMDRIKSKTYSDSQTPAVTYTYDDSTVANSVGRLTAVSSAAAMRRITGYDVLGRPAGSGQTTAGLSACTNGQAECLFSDYVYDYYSLLSMKYPSGRQVETEYDVANRPVRVWSGAQEYATNALYADHGALKQVTFGNMATEVTNFEPYRMQPYKIGLTGPLTWSVGYSYCGNVEPGTEGACAGNNGNVLRQKITAGAAAMTQHYGYDKLNRLLWAVENPSVPAAPVCPDGSSSWCEKYAYDRYGNRTVEERSGMGPAELEPAEMNPETNRIKATLGTSWHYDGAGNLDRDAVGSTYAWDGEGRMTAYCPGVSDPAQCTGVWSLGRTVYSYDGDGRRVSKKDKIGRLTAYVYNAAGELAAEYGGLGVEGGGTQYLGVDHLGSTRVVMGSTTRCLDYVPFGMEILAGAGSPRQGRGVTGRMAGWG